MKMGNKLRAVLYMRYSSNAQDDGNSIEAQQKALYRYAIENDLEVIGEYVDRAKTGTNANRPEFKQMIRDARKHMFDVVLVHKLDRFARNRYDSVVNKVELKRYNVRLISVTEQFGDSPEDKMMEGIAEIFAEYYSDNLSREAVKDLIL
jgi:site-specific DNA recombinase